MKQTYNNSPLSPNTSVQISLTDLASFNNSFDNKNKRYFFFYLKLLELVDGENPIEYSPKILMEKLKMSKAFFQYIAYLKTHGHLTIYDKKGVKYLKFLSLINDSKGHHHDDSKVTTMITPESPPWLPQNEKVTTMITSNPPSDTGNKENQKKDGSASQSYPLFIKDNKRNIREDSFFKGNQERLSAAKKQQILKWHKEYPEIKNIIEYLNKTCLKKHEVSGFCTTLEVYNCVKKGFSEKQLKSVIDFKKIKWLGCKKMDQWLRPKTLFGHNFEKYLQEASTGLARAEKAVRGSTATEREERDKEILEKYPDIFPKDLDPEKAKNHPQLSRASFHYDKQNDPNFVWYPKKQAYVLLEMAYIYDREGN